MKNLALNCLRWSRFPLRSIAVAQEAVILSAMGTCLAGFLVWYLTSRLRNFKDCPKGEQSQFKGNKDDLRSRNHIRYEQFSFEESMQNCTRVEDLLSTLRSLGGRTLQGHTLGVPERQRRLLHISKLIEEYCRKISDTNWVTNNKEAIHCVSDALSALLAANEKCPLVLQAGVGHHLTELDTVENALSEAFNACRAKSGKNKLWTDAKRFWLQRAFFRTLTSKDGTATVPHMMLPNDLEDMILSMADERHQKSGPPLNWSTEAINRFKVWIRQNAKKANNWI